MIVKSMSRQQASFGQLAAYIARAPASELAENLTKYIGRDAAANTPAILHNTRVANDNQPDAIAAEFSNNAAFLKQRKNGVQLYHEILAFSPDDAPAMTFDMVQDITRKYLELRAPDCLAYAKIHFDKAHIHVHVMISANPIGSAKRLRLSKSEFANVKTRINDYQKFRWPELVHSVVRTGSEREAHPRNTFDIQAASKPAEEKARRIENQTGRKSYTTKELGPLLAQLMAQAHNEGHFHQLMADADLALVQRGKSYSAKYLPTGRSYRFRSLDMAETFARHQTAWRKADALRKSLEDTIATRDRDAIRNYGFADRMMAVVQSAYFSTTARLRALGKTIKDRIHRDTRDR